MHQRLIGQRLPCAALAPAPLPPHLVRYFGSRSSQTDIRFVDEILSALKTASQGRIGMLLVLEQETGLRNYIETGTILIQAYLPRCHMK